MAIEADWLNEEQLRNNPEAGGNVLFLVTTIVPRNKEVP
jgi:hypothetical protein